MDKKPDGLKNTQIYIKMPSKKISKSPRISRSIRLKKYESAYESCIKKVQKYLSPKKTKKNPKEKSEKNPKEKSEKNPKEKNPKEKNPKEKNPKEKSPPKKNKSGSKPLNSYQKFVRDESKKHKYNGMTATNRLSAISKAWKNKKDT